jgi:hypothetical protein
MGCVLRVWGKNFDVDAFLKASSFKPLLGNLRIMLAISRYPVPTNHLSS